ncbi:DNA polymerase III subunit chi [Ferribacterium limneticum]|uniref:DNA polymerase III subunit chi n=1 Tax=Ferribacterium limneticum TaxID=76259 RepID=UPI001CF97ECD|nr:DNA polymerase III subunit chi [Ferribacterium limneticum]UCV29581.1 DNA polymerase III subunit chi [Ferribacterium limneticum]UCV33500.1 DNA polymerase III subunit chi [Ferribacterium limneticum]
MTEVFFYHGASDKIAAACALLSGAYAKKKAVLVYALEKEVAGSVDRMLWTHAPLSFVPHCRADSPLAAETPILITDTLETIPQDERLMNLSREIPPGFSRFQSLIEVVGQDESDRLAARDRVKFYKDRGYEVRYFDLSDR